MSAVAPASPRSHGSGFGHPVGIGARPALPIADFVSAYTTPGSPFYAPGGAAAAARTASLLALARRAGVPVAFTVVQQLVPARAVTLWETKIPSLAAVLRDGTLSDIVPELVPEADDDIIVKQCPSAFFGTDLARILTAHRVDTVILAGCPTSVASGRARWTGCSTASPSSCPSRASRTGTRWRMRPTSATSKRNTAMSSTSTW